MEEKKYYVYVLLNPNKPGQYKYEDLKFDYEPFYVGKGSGKRVEMHYKSPAQGNVKKEDLIKKLNDEGHAPMFEKVFFTNNSIDAYEYEKRLIFTIGRAIEEKGPLLNINCSSALRVNPKTKLYQNIKENKNKIKASVDFPNELFEKVMYWAVRNNIFKFGPAILSLAKQALEDWEESQVEENNGNN